MVNAAETCRVFLRVLSFTAVTTIGLFETLLAQGEDIQFENLSVEHGLSCPPATPVMPIPLRP